MDRNWNWNDSRAWFHERDRMVNINMLQNKSKSVVFKIGDLVKILATGEMYTTYREMAEKIMHLPNWHYNSYPDLRSKYKIIDIRNHEECKICKIAAIESQDGKQYLIGTDGLKKVGSIYEYLLLKDEDLEIE